MSNLVWTVIDAEGFLYGPFCCIKCAIKGIADEFYGKPAVEPLVLVQVPNGDGTVKIGTKMCDTLGLAIKAIQLKMEKGANVERPHAKS